MEKFHATSDKSKDEMDQAFNVIFHQSSGVLSCPIEAQLSQ